MPFDREYYESVYQNYDAQNPRVKLSFYTDLVRSHLAGAENFSILDLGCAFGYFLGSLSAGVKKVGMDISHHAVSRAAGRVPDGRFLVGSCAAPPLKGQFDAIVAFDVLEHVEDLETVRAFAHSAIARNGILVFVVPVYDGPLGPIVRLLDKDPTHIHKRPREWWLNWISADFEVVFWTGIIRYLVARSWYLHFTHPGIRRVGAAIAVVARPRNYHRNSTGSTPR